MRGTQNVEPGRHPYVHNQESQHLVDSMLQCHLFGAVVSHVHSRPKERLTLRTLNHMNPGEAVGDGGDAQD